MAETFYNNAGNLDRLKKVDNPTQADLKELLQYLVKNEYVNYFFNHLNNPAWVKPLYELGWFNKVPPPLEDKNQPGYFSMPLWHEGEYLKRLASQFPNIVKDVALSLETENSRAIRTILEALIKIPVNITAETVRKFAGWAETPFASFMMISQELGIIMEYLAKGGQVEAALRVLTVLVEPVQIKDRYDAEKLIAGTRHDFYWLNQALETNLPAVTEIDPIGVISVAEKQLIIAIELEHDPKVDDNSKKTKSYWRLNISPRSDVNYENDIKNLIVNAIIFALDKACTQKHNLASQVIARYIDNDYSILRRIGIYLLRTKGDQYPDLLEKAYVGYRKEPIIAGKSEFDKFLEAQFNNFPASVKKEIIEERKKPDLQRVDELLKEYPERFSGKTKEEKRKTIIEQWQLEDLAPLASYLENEEKEYYKYLHDKYGQPPSRPEEGVVTSWEGPESPIELDALGKKTISAVVQDLLSYQPPSGEPFGLPSREGFGRILESDVQARAKDYAQNAALFINENLPFVYHTHYFRGLENALKNKERFPLTNVITLCEFIVDQDKDKFQGHQIELGLPSAKLVIAQFLEELFRAKEPYIESDLLDKCGELIVKLLHQDEPFPDNEQGTGYDPATHSLNCIHGVAMHCIVSYGLYCERKRKKEKGEEGTPVMVPLVKETLTEELDKAKNPSAAVHSVFGWYFSQFIYLDKGWALENREKIFPVEVDKAKYWQAAWSAYIRFSDVYTNVFPELKREYIRALEELPVSDKKQSPDRSSEKMATHILKVYLLDMIKLDSDDGLMHLYYQNADDETRSHGAFWLSQVLDSQKPSTQDALWQKIWILWQSRIKTASASNDKNKYSKEMSSFCRLFKNTPLDLSYLYSLIQQTLEFNINGFEVGEVINYLGNNSEKYAGLAISCLYKIVLAGQNLFLVEIAQNGIRQILTSAMSAGDDLSEKAIEIINIFGERGDYSWRSLLDLSKK